MTNVSESTTTTLARWLLLDTSTPRTLVALANQDGVIDYRVLPADRRHARDLLPRLRDMLNEVGWSPASITVIGIVIGPGSYTGLRVGTTIAKTWAYALGPRLVGVTVPDCFIHQIPSRFTKASIFVDAQKDQQFFAHYEYSDSAGWRCSHALLEISFSEYLALDLRSDFATGPGAHRWRDQFPSDVTVAVEPATEIAPSSLWQAVRRRIEAEQWETSETLKPLYLRGSRAEEKAASQPPSMGSSDSTGTASRA